MGIRSILVHLDSSRHTPARVAAAAALAQRHDAHLVGLASTGWITMPPDISGSAELASFQELALREMRELAQASVRDFNAQIERLGLSSYEARIDEDYAGGALAQAARYADLTVVTQPDPDEKPLPHLPQMCEEVLLRSGRPLLVLPYAGECELPAAPRVLVGWNASREAARALHDALPLLRQAARVQVAVFETPQDAGPTHGELPGADIGLWLARHGVSVDVQYVPARVEAGEALLSQAADIGAQLIVAGGYGHSRLREAVLGGVTRTLMHSAPVPVLLSH